MQARALLLTALVAVGVIASPLAANAQAVIEPNWVMPVQDRGDRQEQELRPLREVVAELRARYGGEYVGHQVEQGPRPVYVIRWRMPDGQVRDIRVSAVR